MKKNIAAMLVGIVKRHPDGFGFFIPDDKSHVDVYIPFHSMKNVMSNDRVKIRVERERGGERMRGEIIEVLDRNTKKLAGVLRRKTAELYYIKDEAKAWGQDVLIPATHTMGAKENELVAVQVTQYPDHQQSFKGQVTEVLGNAQAPIHDIKRVILSQNIPYEFPEAVLFEAKKFSNEPSPVDYQNRKDLRDKNLITIDGATAKDFDDAVFVEKHSQGFRLYVAIADVSHYVRPGSAIDDEAFLRGTSVYFPNFVVPMLPEALSNGLCSLNPNVPRLCVVAEIEFDFQGNKKSAQFYEAVMESKARVTYGKAQEIIDGTNLPEFSHVADDILRCADLAKILMNRRFSMGSLDLEIPETELEIDESGVPVDIIRSERLFSHRLIEELMLAANVAVAEFFNEKNIPALYRVHEPPNEEAISTLERFLWNFGGDTKLSGGKLQKKISQALAGFSGGPHSQVLHILTLRSMSQAKYAKENLGHFGLGFDFYTHFTSPIRRYPDLIVHRLLKSQVMPKSGYYLMSEEDLAHAGTILSACEQRSAKSERQIQSIKKARFMEKMVGKEFDGLISSVTKFGIFVLLREFDIDGLVRISDLGNDRFEFDEDHLRLVAKRSGFAFAIGDAVRIRVESTDVQAGQINFTLAQLNQTSKPETTHNQNHQNNRSPKSQNKTVIFQKPKTRFGKKKSKNKNRQNEYSENETPRHGQRKNNSNRSTAEEVQNSKTSRYKSSGFGVKSGAAAQKKSSASRPGKLTMKSSHSMFLSSDSVKSNKKTKEKSGGSFLKTKSLRKNSKKRG